MKKKALLFQKMPTFALEPKAGCTLEMKINCDLFCISLGLHYLCTMKREKTMERQNDLTLMKVRSSRSVLSAAFQYYTQSFRQMLKATWIPAVATALASTATGMLLNMELYFLVPLAVISVMLELLTWFFTARWLARHPMGKLFRPALRHWGVLLGVTICGIILMIPICGIIGIPLLILILAQIDSQTGTMIGDPSGMPSYIPWLTAIVWFIVVLLQVVIRLFIVFLGYYAWGSAEARQREKQKLNILS